MFDFLRHFLFCVKLVINFLIECVAFIRVKNEKASLEDIRKFVKDKLTYFKVPKFIEVVDEYPMTVTGKVQKFELRKEAEEKFGEC